MVLPCLVTPNWGYEIPGNGKNKNNPSSNLASTMSSHFPKGQNEQLNKNFQISLTNMNILPRPIHLFKPALRW